MLTNVARENANVPEGNGKFSGFGNLALNSAGQVAFQASLRDTSGAPNDDTGIYLHNGSALLNIARENAAPPVGDGNFAGFGDPTINALGQVAFQATLRNTSASTDTGIYFHNGTMLTNVARENANVPEGNGKFSGFGNLH